MTSIKLYLLRAVYDWAVENGLTPHLIVDASHTGVRVPTPYVQDGKIVLNVSPQAVQGFELTAEWVTFSARFGGQSHTIECPLPAVRAVYARENGQGVAFPDSEETPPATTPPQPGAPMSTLRKGPVLKRIK
jgi:stringent starvation protein B